jgi:menaquinone-dependent protoporphyrinogen IX oxidase
MSGFSCYSSLAFPVKDDEQKKAIQRIYEHMTDDGYNVDFYPVAVDHHIIIDMYDSNVSGSIIEDLAEFTKRIWHELQLSPTGDVIIGDNIEEKFEFPEGKVTNIALDWLRYLSVNQIKELHELAQNKFNVSL